MSLGHVWNEHHLVAGLRGILAPHEKRIYLPGIDPGLRGNRSRPLSDGRIMLPLRRNQLWGFQCTRRTRQGKSTPR